MNGIPTLSLNAATGDNPVLAMDTAAVAAATGLSENWLNQLRSAGRGPKWLKVGKRALYRPADVAAWLEGYVQQTRAA